MGGGRPPADAVLAIEQSAEGGCGQRRLAFTDYPLHRAQSHAIGLIEATLKQLVGQRLNGGGMHWSQGVEAAITALRAQDLNGHWHLIWQTLSLAA